MNSKTALYGSAALLVMGVGGKMAAAAPGPVAPAAPRSYAELLDPIPNPVALLRADDALRAQQTPRVQLSQYQDHHHHHHHHHNWRYGGEPYYAPACYWSWGPPHWNGFRWVHPRVRVCQ